MLHTSHHWQTYSWFPILSHPLTFHGKTLYCTCQNGRAWAGKCCTQNTTRIVPSLYVVNGTLYLCRCKRSLQAGTRRWVPLVGVAWLPLVGEYDLGMLTCFVRDFVWCASVFLRPSSTQVSLHSTVFNSPAFQTSSDRVSSRREIFFAAMRTATVLTLCAFVGVANTQVQGACLCETIHFCAW